jgi:hypothetical protein
MQIWSENWMWWNLPSITLFPHTCKIETKRIIKITNPKNSIEKTKRKEKRKPTIKKKKKLRFPEITKKKTKQNHKQEKQQKSEKDKRN